jgi:lipopolysaccharide/colanic/teichoic acid biosynthesis glycosyltransferase
MVKRTFDLIISLFFIILFSPVLVLVSLVILSGRNGGIFYFQNRVGKGNRDFKIIKFRTMHPGSDKKGLITIGGNDSRITAPGMFLRKYKLDELPQLFNVVAGDMSLVGPRPEVRKYVELYTSEQKKVLDVKPGITDYASIRYADENEMLGKASDPEKEYVEKIMPAKLLLNLQYIKDASFITDIKILINTVIRILIRP